LIASAETINVGRKLFDNHCASCHGADGKSKTDIADAMKKRPTDQTAKEMRGVTDGEIYYSIAADFRERHIEGGGMGAAVLQLGPNDCQIMHWHTSIARRPAAAGAEKMN
jgi:mono/diheme cytochrome c family protein